MNIKLILPVVTVSPEPGDKVFFLAGPIKGGGGWQKKAISLFAEKIPGAYVVCPCRYTSDELQCLGNSTEIVEVKQQSLREQGSSRGQTIWERHYLSLASKRGSILFWLPEEDKQHPRPVGTGPYARDTYGELGEWRMHIHYEGANVVFGAQAEFPGLSVITKNYEDVIGAEFYVHPTLEETVDAAIKIAL